MDDKKCDACNQVENLKPCGFCGQPVVIRYNTMTGEHYISHEDWNSSCPQRPFYGTAARWNDRHIEGALRAENERLRAELDTVDRRLCELLVERDTLRAEVERLRGLLGRAAQESADHVLGRYAQDGDA